MSGLDLERDYFRLLRSRIMPIDLGLNFGVETEMGKGYTGEIKGRETVGAFCTWMQSVDIDYNEAAIQIVGQSPGTLAIRAIDNVLEEVVLAKIPKTSCITIHTSKISDILAEEGFAGGLGLVIAVWFEKGIGLASKWAGYFDSIQEKEYLPIFWTDEELALLQGTEIDPSGVGSDIQDIMHDYTHHAVPLMQRHRDIFRNMSDTSVESFMKAASLVASRAFGVDDIHGDGMVPLADVFNHKVSVVQLSEEYAIHGAESSSSDSDAHEDVESSEFSSPGDTDLVSFPQPCARGPDAILERCGMTCANGLDLRLHIAIIDDTRNDCLQIMSASPLHKGEEVFNTYGELGNADLVKKYGFCVPENPFTYVNLDKNVLVQSIREMLATTNPRKKVKPLIDRIRVFEELCDIIKDQTELLDNETGEEPFLIYPEGHVSVTVYVFVFIVVSGMCDISISSVEHVLSLNPALLEALDVGVPVSIQHVMKDSCFHLSHTAPCEKERIDHIAQICMKACVKSVRHRREVSQKAKDAQTQDKNGTIPYRIADTLRSSELAILDAFIHTVSPEA